MTEKTISCEACHGEGRILTTRYGGNDPDTIDLGPCPHCEGTGRVPWQISGMTNDCEQDEGA